MKRLCWIVCALALGCEASASSGPGDVEPEPPRAQPADPAPSEAPAVEAEPSQAEAPAQDEAPNGAALEVVELEADAGPLGSQIRRHAAAAAKDGKRLFLEMGAPWCPPCKRAKALLAKPEVAAKLEGVVLLRVDSDVWSDDLDELGFNAPVIPTYYALDSKGAPTKSVRGSTWKTRGLVEQKLLAFLSE